MTAIPAGKRSEAGRAERMRVALVIESAGGGTGRHVLDLARGLSRRNHSVAVIYSPVRADAEFVAELHAIPCLTVHELPLRRSIGLHDVAHFRALSRLLSEIGPFDIVHGHSSKAGALTRLLPASVSGARVYSPHAIRTMDPTLSRRERFFYGRVERLLALRRAVVLAGSADEMDALDAVGIATDRRELLHFAVEAKPGLSRDAARAELGLPESSTVLGFVGRLGWQKAPERAIRALAGAARPDVGLAIAGGGDDDEPRALAEQLGVADRVHFLGHRAVGSRLMGAFDILLVPSRYDSSPYVLLEALNAGVPMIATPVGMAAQIVGEEGAGLEVPNSDDPAAMVAAISELLEPGRLEAARRAATDLSRRRSFDAMLAQVEAAYRRALADPPARRRRLDAGTETAAQRS